MLKLFIKAGTDGGAVTGALLSDTVSIRQSAKPDKEIPKDLNQITSIDDIELFEKTHGCFFAFVQTWGTRTIYGAREFVEQEVKKDSNNNRDTWTSKVVSGVNNENTKNWCKSHPGIITLFNNQSKGFELGEPTGGW